MGVMPGPLCPTPPPHHPTYPQQLGLALGNEEDLWRRAGRVHEGGSRGEHLILPEGVPYSGGRGSAVARRAAAGVGKSVCMGMAGTF